MHRTRAVGLIVTSIFAAPIFASAFTFSHTLCIGAAGTAVANVQQFLIDDGDVGLSVTSYFGQHARASVINFQTSQGLTSTGCTGPLTRARINAIEATATPTSPARRFIPPPTRPTASQPAQPRFAAMARTASACIIAAPAPTTAV